MEGNVLFWDDLKGYGFLKSNHKDYFVHHSNIKSNIKGSDYKTLHSGQKIEFESSLQGNVALNVRICKCK